MIIDVSDKARHALVRHGFLVAKKRGTTYLVIPREYRRTWCNFCFGSIDFLNLTILFGKVVHVREVYDE